MKRALLLLGGVLLTARASAVELYQPGLTAVDLGGDVKSYYIGIWPYDHPLLPEDPWGQGLLDARVKLEAGVGDWLRLSLHHDLAIAAGPRLAGFGLSPGGGGGEAMPQALDLSWRIVDATGYTIDLRVDRAALLLKLPHVDLTVGRQPVSFGSTFFFTPLDLVAPFSPVVIDREYKPGVDAVRGDLFFGTSGKLTLVAAYAGDWDLQGSILAGRAGATFWNWDVGMFVGEVREQAVLGLDTTGDLFGVAVRGEGTVTFARGEDPFGRIALGADRRLDCGLTLMGEIYVQTNGAAKAKEYLRVATDDRHRRGELWAMGRYYAALSASYELLPIVNVSFFSVVNLADPSALIGPALVWSVAENAELAVGGYYGLGERPKDPRLPEIDPVTGLPVGSTDLVDLVEARSEFGLSPAGVYAELKVYY
ncbi:MAG: hypothetical protein JXR83_20555 [Deltaproteobacteria bacterium]|nr:hypothetical protein [Deltaproteobacteria bacterium]